MCIIGFSVSGSSTVMASKPPSSLPFEEHKAFQLVFWRAQRIAWIGFALVLMLALAGLTGAGGPLSRSSSAVAGGVIDHPRLSRWSAADEFRVRLDPGAARREVLLSSAFSDHFQIEDVQPAPVEGVATPEGSRLIFSTEPGRPAAVVLRVRALKAGPADYAVGLDGGAPRPLRTIVLP